MICVSAGNIDLSKLKILLESENLVEIRLDMNNYSDDELIKIFSSQTNTIATCRPGRFTEAERIRKLELCIESGASFVDVEVESTKNSIKHISETAKENNCRIIISYHNNEKTPLVSKLINICRVSAGLGADIIKIATYVNDQSDNAKLLSLYSNKEFSLTLPVIAIGMGKLGKITRIAAPFMGAPFTYASYRAGQETAEGQIGKPELKRIYKIIDDEQ